MITIKRRDPVLVIVYSIITVGIYLIYWAVKTKEEMKSLGADIPTMWLLIVPIGNLYLLYKYCEAFSGYLKKDKLGPVWFLIALAMFPIIPVLVQIELNKLVPSGQSN